ncbi:MAG: hypothetical protein JOZ29_06315, partial [Deltaproteobacteria bacterium]|nr:hypothetical protein [Deltaproteobacteria bacterium]
MGGGIYNDGSLTVSGSTISGNTATTAGGGVANENGATALIVNSTFNGNTAISGDGGAITSGSSTLSVMMSSISGNTAGADGGGIFIAASDPVTLTNSIVASNTAQTSDDISGTFTDGSGNVITPTSPIKLGALGNYGGPTQTMLPQPGSPAICAGDATKVSAGTTTDQRGFPIGAAKYCSSGQIDSGAVQTRYTSIQFTNKGTGG